MVTGTTVMQDSPFLL